MPFKNHSWSVWSHGGAGGTMASWQVNRAHQSRFRTLKINLRVPQNGEVTELTRSFIMMSSETEADDLPHLESVQQRWLHKGMFRTLFHRRRGFKQGSCSAFYWSYNRGGQASEFHIFHWRQIYCCSLDVKWAWKQWQAGGLTHQLYPQITHTSTPPHVTEKKQLSLQASKSNSLVAENSTLQALLQPEEPWTDPDVSCPGGRWERGLAASFLMSWKSRGATLAVAAASWRISRWPSHACFSTCAWVGFTNLHHLCAVRELIHPHHGRQRGSAAVGKSKITAVKEGPPDTTIGSIIQADEFNKSSWCHVFYII